MNNNFANSIVSNITCRFSSIADRKIKDDRVSLNIPNTSLYVNFVIRDDSKNVVAILKKQGLEDLGLSDWELFECALKNTSQKELVRTWSLEDALGFHVYGEILNVMVTNESLRYGAIAILYEGVYKSVYDKLGDFYILPASVHEVICVPKAICDKDLLLDLVQSINKEYGRFKDELLADDIFEFRNGMICSSFIDNI